MSLAPPLYVKRRRMVQASSQTGHVPAPVGGLNTIDRGYQMPDGDCPVLYNMIGAENGLRGRLGYKEWCTGVGSSLVPTIIPFAGSSSNGSKDKLFATSTGTAKIYSVGASSAAPTAVFTFGSSAGDAGWGVSHGLVNSTGQHFCMYFDEQNGYHVYSETNDTWVAVTQQASVGWQNTHVYVLNDRVVNGGITYKCTTGGTSAASGGPTGVGTGIADNTAVWAYEPSITGVNPANFVFGTVWKNYALFVEKDSSRMWFGADPYSLYGLVTSFDFGAKFKHGGNLVGLWSWTGDGGEGIDDHLIAISSSGDVVIYKGTNPNTAYTFEIKAVWYVGGVPAGRRIVTDHGGDALILGNMGVISIAKLVNGASVADRTQYATQKIGNLFARSAATYGTIKGWSLRLHPEDSTLLITVPYATGQPTTQLAMSLFTHSWTQYRDLPMLSNEVWGGKLYFGTIDGRVCQNTDYIDNVLLSNPNSFSNIQCSGITAFRNMGNGRQKQLQMIRPTIISESAVPGVQVEARYRYDLTEVASVSGGTSTGKALWDVALWDVGSWGGQYATLQNPGGAVGMGPDVAIAFRFAVSARTVLVGFDIAYTEGGML